MIDHFTLTVTDLARSKAFYQTVLAPLGYTVQLDFETILGFGEKGKPTFWLRKGEVPTTSMHIAFVAPSRAQVDAFHAAALQAGAKDDGAPGVRTQYHPTYYGAFVLDPLSGHPIEAVCHGPPVVAAKAGAKAPSKAVKPVKAKAKVLASAKKKVAGVKAAAKKKLLSKKRGR